MPSSVEQTLRAEVHRALSPIVPDAGFFGPGVETGGTTPEKVQGGAESARLAEFAANIDTDDEWPLRCALAVGNLNGLAHIVIARLPEEN